MRLPSDESPNWVRRLPHAELVSAVGKLHLARAVAYASRDGVAYMRTRKGVLAGEAELAQRAANQFVRFDGEVHDLHAPVAPPEDPHASDEWTFDVWNDRSLQSITDHLGAPEPGVNWRTVAGMYLGVSAANRQLGASRGPGGPIEPLLRSAAELEIDIDEAALRPLAGVDQVFQTFHAHIALAMYRVETDRMTRETAASERHAEHVPEGWAEGYSRERPAGNHFYRELDWGAASLLLDPRRRLSDVTSTPTELFAVSTRAEGARLLLERHRASLEAAGSLDATAFDELTEAVSRHVLDTAVDIATWMHNIGALDQLLER
jgi:hypothetical protein